MNFDPFSSFFLFLAIINADFSISYRLDQCGDRPVRVDHVMGGWEAEPNFWPWAINIRSWKNRTKSICGGVLISEETVLSAAHCFFTEKQNYRFSRVTVDLFVAVGSHKISVRQPKEQHIGIKEVLIHEGWSRNNTESWENDIAILILRSKIRHPEVARPICLPAKDDIPLQPGEKCVVFGWGQREGHEENSDVLIHSVIPILSRSECMETWNGKISPTNLCGGTVRDPWANAIPKGPCQGDSGGPLICMNKNHWIVYGVVSWGSMICLRRPAVFTDVMKYIHWLHSKMTEKGLAFPEPVTLDLPQQPRDNCHLSDFEVINRLQVNAHWLKTVRHVTAIDCVKSCCVEEECKAVTYYSDNQECRLMLERHCDLTDSDWLYPADQDIVYMGLTCSP